MLELLALVVLVAIFFGVSLSAALSGVIVALIVVFVVCAASVFISPFIEAFWVRLTTATPKPKKAKPADRFANIKTLEFNPKTQGWALILFVTYLITAIIILATGLSDTDAWRKMPTFIGFLIPALPFVFMLIISIIKKRASKH